MDESKRGVRGQSMPGANAALIAAGLGRLVADALALAQIEPAALRARIGRIMPLLAERCVQLGGALPSAAELRALSAIVPSPRDPAGLRRGLGMFLEDIETVALLAAHAGDAETSHLLDDLRMAVAGLVRAVDRLAGDGG